MIQETFAGLINNVALLLIMVVLYNLFPLRRIVSNLFLEKIFTGVLLGLIGVLLIMNPLEIREGVLFDARAMFIGIAALFFGPTPSLILVSLVSLYRFSVGGAGVWIGIATILTAAGIGLIWRFFDHKSPDEYKIKELFLLGLLLHTIPMIYLVMLPKEMAYHVFYRHSLMMFPIYPFATALLGKLLARQHKQIKIEQSLIESEFFLKRSQDAGGVGSFVLNIPDDDPNVQTWVSTPEMDRIFGIDATYPKTGESWLALVVQRDEVEAYFNQQVFGAKKNLEQEYQIVRPSDGETRWIFARGELEFDDQGTCMRMFGTVQDITERKQMEQAIKENEVRLHTLLQTIPDLIWLKDEHGVYLACNKMFERFFGARKEDVVGKTDYDFVDKALADSFREHDCRAMAAVKPSRHEEWLTFADDGHRALFDTIKMPMFDAEGNLVGVLGVGRDVTEHHKASEERAKLQTQLQQAQKMESVGRLAGGVAHDFNNMLGVIIGHAELSLEKLAPSNPLFHTLKTILNAAERSADITRQLLAFARKQTVAPRVLDLNEAVAGMIKMLKRLIGEDIDIAWLPGTGVWPVKMDSSQIDQILANLCVNARDAIEDQGRISIETGNVGFDAAYCAEHPEASVGDFVMIAVSDDGHGMDEETLGKIFEPFFTTKAMGKGTGLGLATIYGIAKQNNGFINVYSEPGRGTTFRIYLPRHSDGTIDPQANNHLPQELAQGKETILLVEDAPDILDIAEKSLKRLGYKVLAVSTPGEALQAAKNHAGKIHLLITDVIMPGMNGQELAQAVAKISPELGIVYMSGYTADIIARHGVLDEGINFIPKPFSIQKLAESVRKALDNKCSMEYEGS